MQNVDSNRGPDGQLRLSLSANKPPGSTSIPELTTSDLSSDPGARLLWEVRDRFWSGDGKTFPLHS